MPKPTEKSPTLETWWLGHAAVEAEQTVRKMREYGSKDLIAVGRQVGELARRTIDDDVRAFEIGCQFYLIGKIERAVSAIQRGEAASGDTWFDIAIYAKMVQAKRSGAWDD